MSLPKIRYLKGLVGTVHDRSPSWCTLYKDYYYMTCHYICTQTVGKLYKNNNNLFIYSIEDREINKRNLNYVFVFYLILNKFLMFNSVKY